MKPATALICRSATHGSNAIVDRFSRVVMESLAEAWRGLQSVSKASVLNAAREHRAALAGGRGIVQPVKLKRIP